MTLKKLLSLLLAMCMSAAMLAACGDSDDDDDNKKSGYKEALDTYFDSICDKDGEKLLSITYPNDLIKYLMKEEDMDKDEMVSFCTQQTKYIYNNLEDDFGENIKISYKITNKDRLDEEDLEDYEEDLNYYYEDIDFKVKDGYEVELELTIKGKDDKEDGIEATANILKVNGDWIIEDFDCDDYSYLG